ncbi:unnamed protein product [Rotaria sp. Silwood1]|nr:unnamed protein product [Rotaria sp. Silwood1]
MTDWTFFKSSKKLCKTNTNECRSAYSGQPGETDQTKKNKGPIPDGNYTFGEPKGKKKFPLIPDQSNNMYGRDAFQIHGDNGRGDNSAISFLHPNCRVIFNGQVAIEGAEAMRPTYENDFLSPQASAIILEYHEDTNNKDRIRVLLKTHDNRLIDVTYIFEMKKTDEEVNSQKMIEHIIHSVKCQQDSQS